MPSLREGLQRLAEERNLGKSSLRRVDAALRTLERELGPVDFLAVTGKREFGQKVHVPKSRDVWLVYGEYSDGTLDIIKEDGIFPRDTLVGWTPGESEREYWKKVAKESKNDPAPKAEEEKSNVRPLFRTPPKRRTSKSPK